MEKLLIHNLAIILVVLLNISRGLSWDPCINYASLKDQFHRSVAFPVELVDSPKCDSTLNEGWYRVESKSGADMITTCPSINRCGTYYPLWLNGSLPSETDGIVSRTVCLAALKGCCETEIQIQIKNCGNYTVYYLKQSPGCPQAYCFGTEFVTTTTTIATTTTTIATTTTGNNVHYIELHGSFNITITILGTVVCVFLVLCCGLVTFKCMRKQHKKIEEKNDEENDTPPPYIEKQPDIAKGKHDTPPPYTEKQPDIAKGKQCWF